MPAQPTAAMHRPVLQGHAPELARVYPSTGGSLPTAFIYISFTINTAWVLHNSAVLS